MTLIEFHFNVADKFSKIAQLAQQFLDRGASLTILCPNQPASLALQQSLQSHASLMLPADWPSSGHPAIHVASQLHSISHDDVLINLQHPSPKQFSCFLTTIEIVSTDEQDKVQARDRYRFYRERGYQINHVDVALEK